MVKTYLKYKLNNSFGIISPLKSNCLYDKNNKNAISGGVNNVLIYNMRTGNLVYLFLYDLVG